MRPKAVLLAFVLLSSAMAAPAGAQTARPVELGVGYAFLRITEGGGLNLPVGWLASVAVRTTDWLAVVGEVAGQYRTESGATLRLHTFQAGVRVQPRRHPAIRPYGQILFGAANAGAGGDSGTEFSLEPGVGVDVPVGGRLALRAGTGFPMAFVGGLTVNAVRVHVGVVF